MSSSPYTPTSTFNLFSLPPELVEQTLVLSASCGFPSAIASLSQTCKYLHNLVWQANDHHLWREIFLTTFDDPRPVMTHLRLANSSELEHQNGTVTFNWAEEFVQRMSAAKYILRWTDFDSKSKSTSKSEPHTSPFSRHIATESEVSTTHCTRFHSHLTTQTPTPLLRSLRSLLSVLSTSIPFPRIIDFTHSITPTFPAIVLLRSSPPFPSSFQSRNTAWIEATLSRGYPPALTRRLFAPLTGRHSEVVDENVLPVPEEDEFERVKYAEWEDTEEGRLFYKLVFLKSFIPIPDDEQEDRVVSTPLHRNDHETASDIPGSNTPSTPPSNVTIPSTSIHVELPHTSLKSPDQQVTAARALARSRVYNSHYLTRERCWGPFLLLTEGTKNEGIGPQIRLRRSSGTPVEGALVGHSNSERLDGDSCQAPDVIGGESESSITVYLRDQTVEIVEDEYNKGDHDEYDDEDDDPDILDLPLIDTRGTDFSDYQINEKFVFPPHRLVPDYAFLASARLLIESNLREMLREHPSHDNTGGIGMSLTKVVEAFGCLELVRMGGAPEFWTRGWSGGKMEGGNQDGLEDGVEGGGESIGDKGKGKARDSDGEVEGWDWAGVAGEWR